jgi:hypothetical protein
MDRYGKYRLPSTPRRTIYGYIDRADLLEVLNTFDFANPDMPTGKRYETTVPQQALFLMNSPLVIEQVRNVVNRAQFKEQKTDEDRIGYLYELFFQRLPMSEEIRSGLEFVATFQAQESTVSEALDVQSAAGVAGQVNPRKRSLERRSTAPSRGVRKPLTGWQEYAHALLLTNEASFVN